MSHTAVPVPTVYPSAIYSVHPRPPSPSSSLSVPATGMAPLRPFLHRHTRRRFPPFLSRKRMFVWHRKAAETPPSPSSSPSLPPSPLVYKNTPLPPPPPLLCHYCHQPGARYPLPSMTFSFLDPLPTPPLRTSSLYPLSPWPGLAPAPVLLPPTPPRPTPPDPVPPVDTDSVVSSLDHPLALLPRPVTPPPPVPVLPPPPSSPHPLPWPHLPPPPSRWNARSVWARLRLCPFLFRTSTSSPPWPSCPPPSPNPVHIAPSPVPAQPSPVVDVPSAAATPAMAMPMPTAAGFRPRPSPSPLKRAPSSLQPDPNRPSTPSSPTSIPTLNPHPHPPRTRSHRKLSSPPLPPRRSPSPVPSLPSLPDILKPDDPFLLHNDCFRTIPSSTSPHSPRQTWLARLRLRVAARRWAPPTRTPRLRPRSLICSQCLTTWDYVVSGITASPSSPTAPASPVLDGTSVSETIFDLYSGPDGTSVCP